MTLQASPSMCYYCFSTLIEALESKNSSIQKQNVGVFMSDLVDVRVECPLFITWDKTNAPDASNPKWQLRGCIGTLSPRLLVDAIGEYTLISAFKDRRFRPIQLQEIPFLRVAVSLLVNYEPCQDAYDWTVGIHGIMIQFVVEGRSYSATYLPEVAREQGWTIPQTVESLMQKAGYRGQPTPEVLRNIQCTRYQSSKCRVTFAEYLRDYCNGQHPFHQLTSTMSAEQKSRLVGTTTSCKQM